ncbi:DegT/DnrJ/EryC1/StrS family aminotransferase [Mycobacterium sp.]|uniref:DegT/DnrJ/EryC1/StrS family aminotransferase n=1 Tax=Mycobacterium sp. TaxID=1785 RepID=UPI003F97F198
MSRQTVPIPVFSPNTDAGTIKAVVDALADGWLGMGRLTQEFEVAIGEFLGLRERRVVALNTGTSALHVALRLAGVGPGDEVITTSFNYVADHQAIRMCGAEPVMADISEMNLGMTAESAKRMIGPRTRVLLPLHFAGIPADLATLYALAEASGLRVVEDACHAFGTTIGDRAIGSFGDITCFSFDPVKIVTSLDGGCVIVPDAAGEEQARLYRFLGVDKETHLRYENARAWEYDVVSDGFRYHLNSVSAAVGLSQMARVHQFIETRQAVCTTYSDAFSKLSWCKPVAMDFGGISPFIYSLRVLGGLRPAFISHMDRQGVATGIHFVPVHRHSYFRDCRSDHLVVTERVCDEVVTLPLHSLMPERTVERVVEAVTQFRP